MIIHIYIYIDRERMMVGGSRQKGLKEEQKYSIATIVITTSHFS